MKLRTFKRLQMLLNVTSTLQGLASQVKRTLQVHPCDFFWHSHVSEAST